jgi:hypothetical protein
MRRSKKVHQQINLDFLHKRKVGILPAFLIWQHDVLKKSPTSEGRACLVVRVASDILNAFVHFGWTEQDGIFEFGKVFVPDGQWVAC